MLNASHWTILLQCNNNDDDDDVDDDIVANKIVYRDSVSIA